LEYITNILIGYPAVRGRCNVKDYFTNSESNDQLPSLHARLDSEDLALLKEPNSSNESSPI
jgi:hypothetical protein